MLLNGKKEVREMTTMSFKEYCEHFDCFPEVGKWIKSKEGDDYRVEWFRSDYIVLLPYAATKQKGERR